MNPPVKDAPQFKIFISYSRSDMAFADELVDGLEYSGFETSIDRHSILEGEDWKKRLGALIADADTVVFILSPDSVSSDICCWEVEEAFRMSKRVLPVLCRQLGEMSAPALLAALNYVRFDGDRSFMAGLRALARALNSDVDWLREHTRLLARAMEWDRGGRPENRLLSGRDIDDAKAWAAQRPKDAPDPTPLHLDFIRESAQAEDARRDTERTRLEQLAAATQAREEALKIAEVANHEKAAVARRVVQRTLVGLAVAIVFAVAAAISALYAFQQQTLARAEAAKAETERQAADAQRQNAEKLRQTAEAQRAIAEQQKRLAQTQRDLLAPGPLVETKIGEIDAPIIVIEYSSMTCSHCVKFHADTFPLVKAKYIDKGLVLYISREFPLDNLSAAAYMLARCKKSDQSFEIVQNLFRQNDAMMSGAGTAADKLFAVVKDAGFSREEFNKCLSDQTLLDSLTWVRDRGAKKLGINSTPTFFINEHRLIGNRPFVEFEAIFAKYLPAAPK